MTATNIRTIEENTENKLSERIVQGSVYTNRSDWWPKPVRPVSTQKMNFGVKVVYQPL